MFKEFREFAIKGNVVGMAVGIIIGAAFGNIVTSLVEDIIMPPIGMVLGKVDFANLYINLSGQQWQSLDAAKAAGAPIIRYGVFLNQAFSFLIVAFAVFLLVKAVNRLRRAEDTVEEATESGAPQSPDSQMGVERWVSAHHGRWPKEAARKEPSPCRVAPSVRSSTASSWERCWRLWSCHLTMWNRSRLSTRSSMNRTSLACMLCASSWNSPDF